MKNLDVLRKQIDKIDESIIILLAKRMERVKKIGQIKKQNNLKVLDLTRWQKVIKTKQGYVRKIWEIIHDEALKIEKSL